MATQEDYWDNPTEDDFVSLGHFIGLVKRSYWSDAASESEGKATYEGADATQLYWQLEVLDVLQEDYDGKIPDPLTINLGIGKKWWIDPQNENIVEHEDDDPSADKQPRFQPQSGFGKVLTLVAGVKPVEEVMADFMVLDEGPALDDDAVDYGGVAKYFRENGFLNARDCTIWNGMIFEFRGLGRKMKDVAKPRSKPFPVRYAGNDPDAVEVGGGQADMASNFDVVWGNADPSTAKTLNQLMGKASTHEEFVANASLLPKVKNNEDLLAEVQDPGNFKA